MKIIRNAIVAGALAAATIVACSNHGSTGAGTSTNTGGHVGQMGQGGQNGTGGIGSVGASLTIGTGLNIYDLSWNISGGPGGSYPGTVHIGDAQSAEWVAGGILAGCGYSVNVTGSDSQNHPCNGTSGTFCVTAGASTYVALTVTCVLPNDAGIAADVGTGSVYVDAQVVTQQNGANTCPGITSFAISPAEVLGSQLAQLSVVTTPTLGTKPATNLVWTASPCSGSGTATGFVGTDGGADLTDPNVAFNCGSCTGNVTVTVQAQNQEVQPGDDASTNVCNGVTFTTFSGVIVCEGGGSTSCFSPTPNLCGSTCTNTAVDPANCGMCGHACAAPTTTCSGGSCVCPGGGVLSGGICCPAATPTNCGGVCVNEQANNGNCGTCGHACTSPATCQSGSCIAPLPTVCTASPCTGNVVTCPNQGSATSPCTPDEALFVALDIGVGKPITAAGPAYSGTPSLTSPVCLSCLAAAGCIDFPAAGTTGIECGDLPSTSFTAGNGFMGAKNSICHSTLNCMVAGGSACAANGGGDSFCYCGACGFAGAALDSGTCTGGGPTTCKASGGDINGACEVQEANGFTFMQSDAQHIVTSFADTTGVNPSGIANQMLACASANGCNSCLQ